MTAGPALLLLPCRASVAALPALLRTFVMISELRLCVPVNASWERHVQPEHVPAASYLLHTITQRRTGWHSDQDGLVALKCEYLRRLVGRAELPVVRRALAGAGVIDWRRDFVPGVRSMRYRIQERFQPSQFVTCRDPALLRRVRRVYAEDERRLLPVHRWLKSKLAALRLDVDCARSIVSGMSPDPDSPLDVETFQALIGDQVTRFAEQLVSGNVRLTCDDFGRIHTPLTNLPKSLRCCVSSQDGPLIGLDLSNSQPLFIGLIAMEYVSGSKQARHKLRTWKPPATRYERQQRPATRRKCSITMAESAQPIGEKHSCVGCLRGPTDLSAYLELCETGRLYESLMPPDSDRGTFKKLFFRDVLYGMDRHPSKVRARFAESFPTVAEVITALKSDDYRRLARLMQHQESSLFIGRVCRRLQKSRPSMPLLTIHDSLVTTEEHIEYVRAALLDEFTRIGVVPHLKRENWSVSGCDSDLKFELPGPDNS